MSRIGKNPIPVPGGVSVTVSDRNISVKGPKGLLSRDLPGVITVRQDGDTLLVERPDDERENRARTLTGDHNPQTQMTSFEQDLGKPTIDIAAPVAGVSYEIGSTVPADFSCADAETAIESCVGTVADGAPLATGQTGHFEFTVTAKDLAGNTETKTVVYSVLHDAATGNVSGSVPGTLALTIAGPAVFSSPFAAGVAKLYTAGTMANVVSSPKGGEASNRKGAPVTGTSTAVSRRIFASR